MASVCERERECVRGCVYVCVCVCERERERERETGSFCVGYPADPAAREGGAAGKGGPGVLAAAPPAAGGAFNDSVRISVFLYAACHTAISRMSHMWITRRPYGRQCRRDMGSCGYGY